MRYVGAKLIEEGENAFVSARNPCPSLELQRSGIYCLGRAYIRNGRLVAPVDRENYIAVAFDGHNSRMRIVKRRSYQFELYVILIVTRNNVLEAKFILV